MPSLTLDFGTSSRSPGSSYPRISTPTESPLMKMDSAPRSHRQTLRQAKASYKARGSTHISTAERRAIERGAELDRRADRVKYAERKRKEAEKKKKEQEEKERWKRQELGIGLATQLAGYSNTQKAMKRGMEMWVTGAKGGTNKWGKLEEERRPEGKKMEIISEDLEKELWDDGMFDDETLLGLGEDEILANKARANQILLPSAPPAKEPWDENAMDDEALFELPDTRNIIYGSDGLEGPQQQRRALDRSSSNPWDEDSLEDLTMLEALKSPEDVRKFGRLQDSETSPNCLAPQTRDQLRHNIAYHSATSIANDDSTKLQIKATDACSTDQNQVQDPSGTLHHCQPDSKPEIAQVDLGCWEEFLTASTQIAREISQTASLAPKQPAKDLFALPPFSTQDLAFSQEELDDLGAGKVQPDSPRPVNDMLPPPRPTFRPSLAQTSGPAKTAENETYPSNLDRRLMPPPNIVFASRLHHTARPGLPTRVPLMELGTSSQELESVFEGEIQLTQFG